MERSTENPVLYREPGQLETGKAVFGRHSGASGGKPPKVSKTRKMRWAISQPGWNRGY